MKRQKLIVHVSLALLLIMVAALVGQIRRWQSSRQKAEPQVELVELSEDVPPQVEDVAPQFPYKGDEPELLVRFRPETTSDHIERITSRLNDRIEDEIEAVRGLVAIDDLDDADVEQTLEQYRRLPEVEYAEANHSEWTHEERYISDKEVSNSAPLAGPNDPMFAQQWALSNSGQRDGKAKADIDALEAWVKTRGNNKVVVAVLDSGVDYTHQDLAENMWIRPASVDAYEDKHLGRIEDEHGFDAVTNDGLPDPMDVNGHGTHCAGIIGAVGDNGEGIAGVNWKVEIMPLRFMSSGGFGSTKDAIEAINYVIDRKRNGVNVRVISASWGSTRSSRALEDAIKRAGEDGILFVAAAGNSSVNTDRSPHYPSSYKLPNVVSVAALDRRDQLAGFSNYGTKSVHVAAPGKEILSTWPKGGYEEHSGTSMATPVVSGIAALVLSCEPELKLDQLKQRLMDSVDKLDSLKGKTITGGRINAARAVGAVK